LTDNKTHPSLHSEATKTEAGLVTVAALIAITHRDMTKSRFRRWTEKETPRKAFLNRAHKRQLAKGKKNTRP